MHVIGLMSGTSVDGVDAALVEISGTTYDLSVEFITGITYPYPQPLRQQILDVCHGHTLSIEQFAQLDDAIAQTFAEAVQTIQSEYIDSGQINIDLVGSHGQTVFHRPPIASEPSKTGETQELGYSLQLGRGERIAHITNIPTVCNFRAADIALGGHGAPLVPAVDAWLLSHPTEHRCMQNIGGISNVTDLPPWSEVEAGRQLVRGWDTGPGNALIDVAVQYLSNGERQYDHNGAWAASGTPHQSLIDQWLRDAFFHRPPPKSTGREKFGAHYTHSCLREMDHQGLSATDMVSTLTEFTAATIALNYAQFLPKLPDRILVAGGGSHNQFLMNRLQRLIPESCVVTTDEEGVNADYKEAIAFAVLAYWRWNQIPGNLPSVTGAKKSVLLGEIHLTPSTTKDTMKQGIL